MSLTTSPALLAELVTVRCFWLKSIRSWLLPPLLSLLLCAPASQAADDTLTTLLKGGKQAEITQLLDGKVISTDITAQDDQKIQKRLEQLYKDIDGFKALKVTVKNSIVTVSGELDSATSALSALQYARQVEGVIGLNDKITVNRGIKRRLESTWARITGIIKDGIGGLPILLLAIMVFAGFWWLGRWLSKRQAFYRKLSDNYFIASLIAQVVSILVIGSGFLVALIILDATSLVKTILGAAGIIGLAISFAVRDTVENYIASILLSIRNPFNMNDLVKIGDQEGRVSSLNSRATMLLSADGSYIRIPNATVFKAVITNYSRNPERRFSFDISIEHNQNVTNAQALATKALKMTEGVLDDPKPSVLIQDLVDEKVILRMQAWVDQEKHSLGKVRSQAIREVKTAFEASGIFSVELPESETNIPQADLVEHQDLNDISLEQTASKKSLASQTKSDENLLSPNAPKEH